MKEKKKVTKEKKLILFDTMVKNVSLNITEIL